MGTIRTVVLIIVCSFSIAAPAEEDPRAEDRKQLRAILADIEKALNDRDFEATVKHLHPNAIITYQNAEVSQGIDGARAYFKRMMEGTAAIVTNFSTKATVGAPAVFYGDIAVAFGTTVDTLELASGLDFTLNANWSGTVVKERGEWKVAAIHFSTNLFDNVLLNNAKRIAWITGAAGFLVGIILMFLMARFRRK